MLKPSYAEDSVRDAFYRARLESRPIVLCAPLEVQQMECDADGDDYRPSSEVFPGQQAIRPDLERLREAAGIVKAAKKPVIVLGRGAMSPAAKEAASRLAERIGALIATTLVAKGTLADSEYYVGVSGLFSARGYNIESLTVAPTEDPTMSRMTIVTSGSDDVIEQITKQLNKLVEVVKVVDLTEGNHIERELMLVKVRAAGKDRDEMKRLADIFRGRILDVTDKSYTIELTGTGSKLDAFLQAIEPGVILETVRTGASGIGRGERILRI